LRDIDDRLLDSQVIDFKWLNDFLQGAHANRAAQLAAGTRLAI
jgi:hypothetical protein